MKPRTKLILIVSAIAIAVVLLWNGPNLFQTGANSQAGSRSAVSHPITTQSVPLSPSISRQPEAIIQERHAPRRHKVCKERPFTLSFEFRLGHNPRPSKKFSGKVKAVRSHKGDYCATYMEPGWIRTRTHGNGLTSDVTRYFLK